MKTLSNGVLNLMAIKTQAAESLLEYGNYISDIYTFIAAFNGMSRVTAC